MNPDDQPTTSSFLDPCKNGHSAQKRSDGYVYCGRCGKQLYKG